MKNKIGDFTPNDPLKKILIDTTFLYDQYSRRGIGRTGREIIVRLIPMLVEANYEVHIVGFETLENNLIKLEFSQFAMEEIAPKLKFHTFGKPVLSGVRNIQRWSNTFKPIIEEVKPEIFFAAHFERGLPSANIFKKYLKSHPKTAVICYDVIPLKTNKFTNKGPLKNFIKKVFYKILWTGIKNADLIFTISNFSKREILTIPDIDEQKIKVVHLGISADFYKSRIEADYDNELIDQVKEFYDIKDKEYFIYDSGIESNKGIFELLHSFAELQKLNDLRIPKYLLLTGADFHRGIGQKIRAKNSAASNVLNQAKKLGILENIITGDKTSERDLRILLLNAKFYLNFSRYEGFGLGIAQAFAAEVPVIASNLSSYPEIAQEAALLVDLNDIPEIVTSVQKFINNDSLIRQNIEKARESVKVYNWDVAAEKYFEELDKLI